MLNSWESLKRYARSAFTGATRFERFAIALFGVIGLTIVLTVVGLGLRQISHLVVTHTGSGRSVVNVVHPAYTGTFGGHCAPQNNLVCITNADKSVTVGDQTFLNGLKPHSVLPNKGTTVTVTVKEVMHRNKHGDTLKATVVSIKRSTE